MNQDVLLSASIAQVNQIATASGLLSGTLTIQQPSGNYDAAGAPDGQFVDVVGLVDLMCMAAPLSVGSLRATEAKTFAEIAAMQVKHLFLAAFYPQITAGWRAVVNGIDNEILGVEWDSQRTQTRLHLQIVNV